MLGAESKPGNILGTWTSEPISGNVKGNNELVPAVAGKHIYVVGITLVSSGPVGMMLKSDGTELTGRLPFLQMGTLIWPIAARGWYLRTGSGESLNMRLSAAVLMSGVVTFYVA